jgi:hypothetical protein
VGPEVSIIPFGKAIAFLIKSQFCHSIHNCSNSGIFFDLSTILITTFSQFTVGKVDTLKSRDFFSIVLDILPSCGFLDSSIFKSDIILNLAITH